MTPKQYLKKIEYMIFSHGGIIKEQKNEFRPPTYAMLTPLGEMQITPYEDFIAIRFVGDLTLAQSYFGKTSMDFGFHNGKWNVQGVQAAFDGQPPVFGGAASQHGAVEFPAGPGLQDDV